MPYKSNRSPLTVEQGEALRHDYAGGMAVYDIRHKYRVSQGTVYLWLDGGPLIAGERPLPSMLLRRPVRPKKTERAKVVHRLWKTAAAHVKSLEDRLREAHEPADCERDARIMAMLVKTLRDLSEVDGAPKSKPGPKSGQPRDAEPAAEKTNDDPRDIDEFRRELARRLAALDPGAADGAAGGT